ncbi:Polyamine aminopropyltransferase [archaeon HR01]|nr:Polyamine aminopropyltransferase [archaeon HR01]
MELKYRGVPLLSGHEAKRILSMKDGRVLASFDLSLSFQEAMLDSMGLKAGEIWIGLDELGRMAEKAEDIYVIGDRPRKLAFYAGKFYRLIQPAWGHAPTLEIDGIGMHRTAGVYPEEDARSKVWLLGNLADKKVLDICTGLGYTATEAIRRGARKVITVETDPNVLEMCSYNPWSRQIFTESVEIVLSDAKAFLEKCDEKFDAVILDPPTIRMAGELYSSEFYSLLAAIIREGGMLVHYVGEPGRVRGRRLYVGVMNRLRKAGFRPRYVAEARSISAYKL